MTKDGIKSMEMIMTMKRLKEKKGPGWLRKLEKKSPADTKQLNDVERRLAYSLHLAIGSDEASPLVAATWGVNGVAIRRLAKRGASNT